MITLLWPVFDHGLTPRIGPRFLWQLKQRTPSSIFSSGTLPIPPMTPKSNFERRLFQEMNSTVFTRGVQPVPWAGKVSLRHPTVPFRQPPEQEMSVEDFQSCGAVDGDLAAHDAEVEAAVHKGGT